MIQESLLEHFVEILNEKNSCTLLPSSYKVCAFSYAHPSHTIVAPLHIDIPGSIIVEARINTTRSSYHFQIENNILTLREK